MAIGAITMILTNVGLQMFNSWRGSKQNAELQQKREEFEQAARERNVAHMMKLMREGQELTLQIEKENHEQRLNDIKGELDNLLQRLTYEMAITNWPLRVLPVVMKNQAFGNLLANQEEKLALHVILTRSNYDKFNNAVLPTVEKSLEQYCNQHWSTMGDHPVLFYSGAWKSRTAPTGSDISSLKTSLSNLPTLLITPLFRPSDGYLVFQINMWGVGANTMEEFAQTELEPTNFQRAFSNADDYDKDREVCHEIIEDIGPYLQCLIGYLADTYFWSSTGVAPLLPTLLINGVVNTDGLSYITEDSHHYYNKLIDNVIASEKNNIFSDNKMLSLYRGCSPFWNDLSKRTMVNRMFLVECKKRTYTEGGINNIEQLFNIKDIPLLKEYCEYLDPINVHSIENAIIEIGKNNPILFERKTFPKDLLEYISNDALDFTQVLLDFKQYCSVYNIENISLLITQQKLTQFCFHTYDTEKDKILRYKVPFNKCYNPIQICFLRNIRSLFDYGNIRELSCHLNRVDYLINKIKSNDLTY